MFMIDMSVLQQQFTRAPQTQRQIVMRRGHPEMLAEEALQLPLRHPGQPREFLAR